MQPEVIEEGVQSNFLSQEDIERFSRCKRFYLETSAFNFLVDNLELADIELTRAYQRRKGVIFATSPMLLWEIMLTSDLERADMMLLAAQALFDPILLGTPTELAVRYLRFAYPDNVVNYDIRSNLGWAGLWPNMTRDFQHTFVYDFVDLIEKTKPIRAISKSLTSIIEGLPDRTEIVELTSTFVTEIYGAVSEDIDAWGMDKITAKFVILYAFLLLMAYADLDGSAARDFWTERGFVGNLRHAEVTRAFLDYPDIFRSGPIVSMAAMAAFQYRGGKTNRGAIHDGMHVVYTPYVDAIISNDAAFLGFSKTYPYFCKRLLHMSEINFTKVKLALDDYPDDKKLRGRD
jgi:hypothetical protein